MERKKQKINNILELQTKNGVSLLQNLLGIWSWKITFVLSIVKLYPIVNKSHLFFYVFTFFSI